MLAACGLVPQKQVAPPQPPPETVPAPDAGAEALMGYITLAGRLAIERDEVARSGIVAALSDDARAQPTPANRLRLAVGQTFTRLPPKELAAARADLTRLVADGSLSRLELQIADICLDLMERQRNLQDRISLLEGQIEALTAIEQRLREQDGP